MTTETVSSPPRRRLAGATSSAAKVANASVHLPTNLLGKLASSEPRASVMVAETVLIPLIAVALGLFVYPTDPLWTLSSFPWSWLAPVVVALRYGPLAGLGSSSVLLAAWLGLNVGRYDGFPQIYFLGGLILTMLVGEFSSLWQARTRRAETVQLYLDQRLEHLVRQYYLLRLSHDRLEQELIGRPMSMRDALSTLQRLGTPDQDAQQGADTLLRLLSQYCQLESATIYAASFTGVKPNAVATIGPGAALQDEDPLVQQALETGKLCHISQLVATKQQSKYLVAAPMLDLGGEIYGLLLIEEMPFFSLQDENLQTINLLLGYYTDGLAMQALAAPIQQQLPDCPANFAFEIQRLIHVRASAKVSSVIVALEFISEKIESDLPFQIESLKRELDESWLIKGKKRQVLAVLMPLGDSATARGYIQRLEQWFSKKTSQSLTDAGIFPHIVELEDDPIALLKRLHGMAHA